VLVSVTLPCVDNVRGCCERLRMLTPSVLRHAKAMAARRLLCLPILVASMVAPAARAQTLVIDGIEGPVTARERDAFKAFMKTRMPPPNPWGAADTDHNALGDGSPGRDVEALGMMYEATQDVEILDRMIFFVDAFVAMRNDLP
jgi:hypothetical protein